MRRLLSAVLTASAVLLAGATVPAGAAVDPGSGTEYDPTRVVVPMTFPVAGRVSYTDNWLVCRSGCARMHMGQDLMGAKMTPLVAAFDGVVTSLKRDTRTGGNYVVIVGDRGPARGWAAIYVHVNNDTPGTDDGRGSAAWAFPAGIAVGSRVLAGQLVGWLGDSGNSESTGPHLHFELRRGDGWGGVVFNAYPSLRAARRLAAPLASGPHPAGSLVRHPSGALFVLEAGRKRPASPDVLAAEGRSATTAVPMSAAESLGYGTGEPLRPRDGRVVRDPRGTTWLLHSGTRTKAGAAALAKLGWSAPRLLPVSDATLARIPVADALPATAVFPGALVRHAADPTVHHVGPSGELQPVPSGLVLASHGLSSREVALVPAEVLADRTAGEPLPLRDGTLVQTPAHVVGVVSGGALRRLWDGRQVRSYGYVGRPRLAVPSALVASLRTGELTGP